MTNDVVLDPELTQDDRLWAALAWIPITPLWPIFAIVALLIEDKKDRPFIRFHAVLSLATGLILIPLSLPLNFLYFLCGSLVPNQKQKGFVLSLFFIKSVKEPLVPHGCSVYPPAL